MCGRISQYRAWEEIRAFYDLVGTPQNLAARYNLAPTAEVGAIRLGPEGRTLAPMRWWLVPAWWKTSLKEVPTAFNAKAEGIAGKPMFRSAFRDRRCVVWADGYYEWKRDGAQKRPFHITRTDGAPLSLAGLWERWTDPADGTTLTSCAIITCAPGEAMSRIHSRMPVVLEREALDGWLSGRSGADTLVAAGEDVLCAREVSGYVNNARHDGPDCIASAPSSG